MSFGMMQERQRHTYGVFSNKGLCLWERRADRRALVARDLVDKLGLLAPLEWGMDDACDARSLWHIAGWQAAGSQQGVEQS